MKQNESVEIATSVKRPKFYQITIRELVEELYDGGKGGETTIENGQVLCSSCNAKKGALDL